MLERGQRELGAYTHFAWAFWRTILQDLEGFVKYSLLTSPPNGHNTAYPNYPNASVARKGKDGNHKCSD